MYGRIIITILFMCVRFSSRVDRAGPVHLPACLLDVLSDLLRNACLIRVKSELLVFCRRHNTFLVLITTIIIIHKHHCNNSC